METSEDVWRGLRRNGKEQRGTEKTERSGEKWGGSERGGERWKAESSYAGSVTCHENIDAKIHTWGSGSPHPTPTAMSLGPSPGYVRVRETCSNMDLPNSEPAQGRDSALVQAPPRTNPNKTAVSHLEPPTPPSARRFHTLDPLSTDPPAQSLQEYWHRVITTLA